MKFGMFGGQESRLAGSLFTRTALAAHYFLSNLSVHVPTLFAYHLGREKTNAVHQSCVHIGIFVAILSGLTKVGVGSVLIARTWAVYGVKLWILISLCLCYAAIAIPGYIMFYTQKEYIENPFPDFISGCTFKTGRGPQLKLSYLAPFLFQTIIMIMTAYKAWSFSREQQSIPIMHRILNDEIKFYFGFVLLLMMIEIGSMIRATKTSITGSLLFTSILSLMCSRLLLHGFTLNRRTNVCTTYHEANEISLIVQSHLFDESEDPATSVRPIKAPDEEAAIGPK